MITAEASFLTVGRAINEAEFSFKGLSTDVKPTGTYMGNNIQNGSTFLEMDTQSVKFYDADSNTWI